MNKFDVTIDKTLRTAKFRYALSNEQLQGFQKHFDLAEALLKPLKAEVEKIKADIHLSAEGKRLRIDMARQEATARLNAIKAEHFNKSEMIASATQRQRAKAVAIREAYRPEDKVLAFLQGQEVRQHHLVQQAAYEKKTILSTATLQEKQESGPLLRALMTAVEAYAPAPTIAEEMRANRRHELTISALLDSPIDLVPQDVRQQVEAQLLTTLAPQETAQLREITAFHETLSGFASDIQTIINEA